MGTPARVVIAAPLPRLPLTAVAPARTRAPYTALVLAAIILDARSVESTSPASIRRAVERSIERSIDRSIHRSIDRSIDRSRRRAIVSPITTRREGGTRRRRPNGGGSRSPVPTRRGVSTSDFYTHRDGTHTCAERIHSRTHIEPISRDVRSRSDRATRDPSRDASDAFSPAGTSAHGGAREDDGRRRRETRDGRRETGDARRETRRRARRARGDDVRLDVSTRKAVGRGETTASVRFFHAWVDAREGLVRRSSLLVGDDSHGFGESSRRISTSRPRGGA